MNNFNGSSGFWVLAGWYKVQGYGIGAFVLRFRVSRAGLFSDLSAWDSYPLRILDFVELRVPPLIIHEKTAPSRQSLRKKALSRM